MIGISQTMSAIATTASPRIALGQGLAASYSASDPHLRPRRAALRLDVLQRTKPDGSARAMSFHRVQHPSPIAPHDCVHDAVMLFKGAFSSLGSPLTASQSQSNAFTRSGVIGRSRRRLPAACASALATAAEAGPTVASPAPRHGSFGRLTITTSIGGTSSKVMIG
jgi:hypothetical protein